MNFVDRIYVCHHHINLKIHEGDKVVFLFHSTELLTEQNNQEE